MSDVTGKPMPESLFENMLLDGMLTGNYHIWTTPVEKVVVQNANISDLVFVDRKPDYYRLIVDVDLRDVEHLHAVMLVLEADSDVAEISRHRDLEHKP